MSPSAIDPVGDVCEIGHGAGAWVHVDGAFGMWAAASPTLRPLVEGVELADSWATDAHKWLNAPYDSGLAFFAHPDSHRRAMSAHADYLVGADEETGPRDELDWNPEFSRRARRFPIYAALRSLSEHGVATLIECSCAQARRLASALAETDGVEIINDVRLNQVLVRFGGRRRADRERDPASTRRERVLDERDDMAPPGGDADQCRELADRRPRHRTDARGDHSCPQPHGEDGPRTSDQTVSSPQGRHQRHPRPPEIHTLNA